MTTNPVFAASVKEERGEPITFSVAGESEPFRVPRPVPVLPLMDLAADAEDDDLMGALASFRRFLKECLGAEWPRFRRSVAAQRFGPEDLLPIVQHIVAEASGRPTVPPSGSPMSWANDGRPPSVGTPPLPPPS